MAIQKAQFYPQGLIGELRKMERIPRKVVVILVVIVVVVVTF